MLMPLAPAPPALSCANFSSEGLIIKILVRFRIDLWLAVIKLDMCRNFVTGREMIMS